MVSLKDGIVRCIAHVKLAFNLDIEKTVAKHYPGIAKPQLPKDLELWLDYNRVNSEKLKIPKKRSKSAEPTHLEEDEPAQKQSSETSESELDKMLNSIDNKLS